MTVPDMQRLILIAAGAARDEADRVYRVEHHAMTPYDMRLRMEALKKVADDLEGIARRCVAMGAPPVPE